MCFSPVAVSECYSLIAVCRLLTVVASAAAEHGQKGRWAAPRAGGLSSCNAPALEHRAQ